MGGCQTTQQVGDYNAELLAYMRCNKAASAYVADQKSDPVSLAIAARGLCNREEIKLRSAVFSGRETETAERVMLTFRTSAVEDNTAEVVKARLRLAAALR